MEGNISSILQHNTACISALHVLKVRPASSAAGRHLVDAQPAGSWTECHAGAPLDLGGLAPLPDL